MTFTKICVIIITENKKGIDYMKNFTYDKPDETESDKKNEWATNIINKNLRRLEASVCYRFLGISFVQLYGGKTGCSKCSKSDKFDPVIGKAVAICHATGEEIPDFI